MIGEVIGNYKILRKLGQGGMGVVYLAEHTVLARQAAIKVMLPALSAQRETLDRFFNEARAATSITDPGIIQIFDFGYHTDGSAFIVMEYLDGETLDRRVTRLRRLPVADVLRLGRQLAVSLAAAHTRGIVHRDLKPENIFLVGDSEVASGERCKILDFGVAKISGHHSNQLLTRTGVLIGTPMYMSPEQCRGLSNIDHRADIYALGCVLFRLLTGRPPFEGEAPGDIISAHIREAAPVPSSLAPDVPPAIDALVLRCLAKGPEQRFQTMKEVAAAIEQAVPPAPATPKTPVPARHLLPTTKIPVSEPPAAPTTLGASSGQYSAETPPRRHRMLWIAGAFVVTSAAIAVIYVAARDRPRREVASPATAPVALPIAAANDRAPVDAHAPAAIEPPPAPEVQRAAPEDERIDDVPARKPAAPAIEAVAKRPSKPRPAPPPRAPAATGTTPTATAPAAPCNKADFAKVYNSASPSKQSVKDAIRALEACHDARALDDADYERIHDALMRRYL